MAHQGGTTHPLGPQISGGHGHLPPLLRHSGSYLGCKALASAGPWQSLPACFLASPAAVYPGQPLVGDLKEVDKEGSRNAHLLPPSHNPSNGRNLKILSFFFFSFFSLLFRAALVACGSSQASGRIRATAASHSHSNARSKLRLPPAPQLTATPDP